MKKKYPEGSQEEENQESPAEERKEIREGTMAHKKGHQGKANAHHHGKKGHKMAKEAHHAHHDTGHHGHRSGHDVSGYSKGRATGDTGGAENTATTGGALFHGGMVAYPDGHGSADNHAHHSHHEANKAYGTPQGSSPKGDGSDDEGGSSHGGEGMESNAEYC